MIDYPTYARVHPHAKVFTQMNASAQASNTRPLSLEVVGEAQAETLQLLPPV